MWYKKSFSYRKREHMRVFLYFGAANYFTRVYLNGQALGEHEGGFTPFNFEVTDQIREGDNFLVAEVNNTRRRDAVPTVNTDWWNYGGFTRDVMLVEVPETFIQDYFVQLAKGSSSEISGWVQLSGSTSPQPVTIEIPEAKIKQTLTADAAGHAEFRLSCEVELRSPEHPDSTTSCCRAAPTKCTMPSVSAPSKPTARNIAQRQAHLSAWHCLHEDGPAPRRTRLDPERCQGLTWVGPRAGQFRSGPRLPAARR